MWWMAIGGGDVATVVMVMLVIVSGDVTGTTGMTMVVTWRLGVVVVVVVDRRICK